MKKQYVAPGVYVVEIETKPLMDGASINSTNVDGLGNGGGTNGKVTTAGSRGSDWDDEY